jgi:hypothetical protein
MISRIHQKLGTAGFIISIVALLVALGGGAYAASGGLTGKQKKEVEKIAKKYAGKPGKDGAAGAIGPQGSPGAAGAKGDAGIPGINGGNGANGTNGESVKITVLNPGEGSCTQGGAKFSNKAGLAEACNGVTGFTETLPPGKTEKGTFAYGQTSEPFGYASISFSIPLETAPAVTVINTFKGSPPTPECAGTQANPTAAPGNLCVYAEGSIYNQYEGAEIVSAGGAVLVFSRFEESGMPRASNGLGTWAATAE